MKKNLIFYFLLSITNVCAQSGLNIVPDTTLAVNSRLKNKENAWIRSGESFQRKKALNHQFYPFLKTASISNDTTVISEDYDNLFKTEKLGAVYITDKKESRTFAYGFHKRQGFLGGLFGPRPMSSVSVNFTKKMKSLDVVYIKDTLPHKNIRIKELLLRIKSVNPDSLVKVKLYVLPVDKTYRQVGINPLNDNIYEVSAKSGLKRFDVFSEHLYMPSGGVLIGVYILKGNLEKKLMPLKRQKSNSYRLNLTDNNLVQIGTILENIESKDIYNLMYGLSVEVMGDKR